MVVPHAARADAAERQVVLAHLHDRLIHADAARENLGDVPLGESLVVGERIERERAVATVDVSDDLVGLAIRLDRQQRPEDLLLHDRHLVVHPENDVRGELAATGIELLVRRQVDDGRPARLRILERRDEPIKGRLIDESRAPRSRTGLASPVWRASRGWTRSHA